MESSFREQLRTGALTVATTTSNIKNKIQKKGLNANYTIVVDTAIFPYQKITISF